MCSSKSLKKSKRKLCLVKELDANSFQVVLQFLNYCSSVSLVYGIKSKTEIRYLTKHGWEISQVMQSTGMGWPTRWPDICMF